MEGGAESKGERQREREKICSQLNYLCFARLHANDGKKC